VPDKTDDPHNATRIAAAILTVKSMLIKRKKTPVKIPIMDTAMVAP
jgi:hypothetical protein